MTEEDILRLVNDYEVVVEGKVSQAAFPYPPMRSPGGVISSIVNGKLHQEYEMRPISQRPFLSSAMEEYEHHLRKMLLSDMQIKMDAQFLNIGPIT